MRPTNEVEDAIRNANCEAAEQTRLRLWDDIVRTLHRPTKTGPNRVGFYSWKMSVSGKVAKVAVVLALVAVGFTVTAVGVHLCRRGRSSEDMLATGRSDTGSDVVREQPAGDGNGTTPAAETAADRADFEVLHQRGNVRVLRMRTTQAKMQGDGRELRPTCVLSAERADGAAREEITHLTAAAWREIDQLQQAGKGQNLGVYKKKVGGREIPFKLQRFVLSDGTVVIISTTDPNDPVPPRP